MADITKSTMGKNAGTLITENNGAASQTIVCNRGDEKCTLIVRNTDAATVLVRVAASGYGAGGQGVLDVQVAQNEVKGLVLESARFKAPSTQKYTVQLLAVGGGTYGGTVTNVKLSYVEAPKGIVD